VSTYSIRILQVLFSYLNYRRLSVPTHVVSLGVAVAPSRPQSPCVQVLISEDHLCDEVQIVDLQQVQVTP
jgi:hypothetical protein